MDHPYGLLSLLPPVAAIVLAIVTRRAALSLFLGVAIGAFLLARGNPVVAIPQLLETHLWAAGTDDGRLRVFAFTLMMGAMVSVMGRCGGMQGLVNAVMPLASTRRRGQLTGWALGLVVFFDDYANTVLLGHTLRSLFDRLKLSREKLAYVVDSTSAPVAGLALISTWVAVEIDNIRLGVKDIDAIPPDETASVAFDLFLYSIPYRFYLIWALIMVPLVALLARDIGPMRRAEAQSLLRAASDDDARGRDRPTAHWLFAIVPIVVCVAVIVALLYTTGLQTLRDKDPARPETLQNIIAAADSYVALLWGSLAGLMTAMAFSRFGGLLTGSQIMDAAGQGAKLMLPALLILWLAASLSGMTGGTPRELQPSQQNDPQAWKLAFPEHETKLYTGTYLRDAVRRSMSSAQPAGAQAPASSTAATASGASLVWLLPTVIFVLASIVAFATGTSWGTMGIVMPMAVPLAYGLIFPAGVDATATAAALRDPLLLCTIGSVLAGAIFGDHCSPISDTTVLSSQASGCDHVAHVWTQLPYALLVGAVAIVCGTLPVGLGASVWLLLPVGVVVMIAALFALGRRSV